MEINGLFRTVVLVVWSVWILFGVWHAIRITREQKAPIFVVFVTVILFFLILWLSSGSVVIECKADGSHRSSTWLFYYRDPAGNRHSVRKTKSYLFFDGAGRENFTDTCEVTVFPIVYTTKKEEVGLPVQEVSPLRFSLRPNEIVELPSFIDYPFEQKRILDRYEAFYLAVRRHTIFWGLDYSSNVSVDKYSKYRERKYLVPENYNY